MNLIEQYLDDYDGTFLPHDITKSHKYFKYDNITDYNTDLCFLLQNVYTNINISEPSINRIEQKKFRNNLLKIYDACVITDNNCKDELEACHIVEVNNGGTYDVQNGIILERNIHSTFDKNCWTICPDTLRIIIKSNHNGTILKYKNVKANIILTPITHMFLQLKYNIFMKKENDEMLSQNNTVLTIN
jgi:hypothetical protein